MPEDKKRAQQKYKTMEGNYLTAGDLALIENRRGYGYGDGYGHYGCYGHGKGGLGYENTYLYHRADASFFEVLQSLLGRPKDGVL